MNMRVIYQGMLSHVVGSLPMVTSKKANSTNCKKSDLTMWENSPTKVTTRDWTQGFVIEIANMCQEGAHLILIYYKISI